MLNFTAYRAAFNTAAAEYLQRCGFVDPSRVDKLKSMSLLNVAPELQSIIDQEVDIGRVRLSTECFAPLKTLSCDINEAFAAISDCITGGKQFVPQVRPGRLCRLQGECIGGYCDLGAVKKPCGMGICAAYLPVGLQCGPGKGQCNPDQATCWQGTCRARGSGGTECLSDADCDALHTCRQGVMDRRCGPRQRELPNGSACDSGQIPDGCKTGDRCAESEPGKGDYKCLTPRSVGGECYLTSHCVSGAVCVGADFAASKKGQCQKQGGPGQSCAAQGSVCQLTLYCSPSGTCKPASDIGGPCEDVIGGQACLQGLCDAPDKGTGTCQAPRADGAMCTLGSACKSGICDKNGTCGTVCAPLR